MYCIYIQKESDFAKVEQAALERTKWSIWLLNVRINGVDLNPLFLFRICFPFALDKIMTAHGFLPVDTENYDSGTSGPPIF